MRYLSSPGRVTRVTFSGDSAFAPRPNSIGGILRLVEATYSAVLGGSAGPRGARRRHDRRTVWRKAAGFHNFCGFDCAIDCGQPPGRHERSGHLQLAECAAVRRGQDQAEPSAHEWPCARTRFMWRAVRATGRGDPGVCSPMSSQFIPRYYGGYQLLCQRVGVVDPPAVDTSAADCVGVRAAARISNGVE